MLIIPTNNPLRALLFLFNISKSEIRSRYNKKEITRLLRCPVLRINKSESEKHLCTPNITIFSKYILLFYYTSFCPRLCPRVHRSCSLPLRPLNPNYSFYSIHVVSESGWKVAYVLLQGSIYFYIKINQTQSSGLGGKR